MAVVEAKGGEVMNLKITIICLCAMALSAATAASGTEKKPVTNADIVTMVKAGLPESTIIIAIKQGLSAFDTSPTALVDLKNQGVSPAILEAMMQPAAMPPTAKTGTGNALLDAYAEMSAGGGRSVVLIDGGARSEMKYATMQSQGRVNFAPFAPSKVYSKLDGAHSSCRVSSDMPRFEFSMSRDIQPSTRVALISFAVRGNSRIIQSMSASMVGVSSGFPKERIVATEITEVKSEDDPTTSGETLYVATPTGTLPPGEYALVVDGFKAYDFGVDASGGGK